MPEAQIDELLKDLLTEFGKHGGEFRIISIAHLRELREDIEELSREGEIDEKFYAENLSFFQFEKPEELPTAESIMVIAIPQGISIVTFNRGGKKYDIVIPPTYIYEEVRETCKNILKIVLRKVSGKITRAFLPLKLLAVRSGLGRYGKNNICYVEGMGSFCRLEAFYTEYSFSVDNWQKVELMDACTKCQLCMKNCPTKAIPCDRVLIDASRCLTLFNENEGEFPQWIDTSSHNALVGCMKCQTVCPANRQFIRMKDRKEEFTAEETEIILMGTPEGEIPHELHYKLEQLNMDEYYSLLSRNLKQLLG